jgi:hypothetical protein
MLMRAMALCGQARLQNKLNAMWIIGGALIPRMTPGPHALVPFVAILVVVLILLLERMYRGKNVIRFEDG